MPDYDFRALSPVDFEHLVRDALNTDLGLKLHSYAQGRDQGIDLRQVATDGRTTVVQCKHYVESDRATFLRAVRKEGERGGNLGADRYIFVTSRPLTPPLQDDLVSALGDLHVAHGDVWGRETLNAALGRCPDVERRHIKLWLSSAGVLDSLINSGRWQRGDAALEEACGRAKFWVHTPAYEEVLGILEREGICIVSGPPGVGKTFLAEMMLLSAARLDWQVVHVANDIEEAWRALRNDETEQIFYYDDFLGQGELAVASKNEPASLARFLVRIRHLKARKRIIMTTREQNLQQAVESFDPLRELARDPARFGLQMSAYDTRARAEILFNHLYFSGLPNEEHGRLSVDNRLFSIVEHPAYNPRLIEFGIRTTRQLTTDGVLVALTRALDNPVEIWQVSFGLLSPLEKQILLTLAALPARPWPLDEIRRLNDSAHPLAWTPALRTLEPTWIRVAGSATARSVTLANPSCRDFLLGILDDAAVASDQVDRIRRLDQIVSLTRSAGLLPTDIGIIPAVQRAELAHALMSRSDHAAALVAEFASADLADKEMSLSARVKTLRDAATLLIVYGSAGATGWLLDQVAEFLDTVGDRPLLLSVFDGFMLAEMLSVVPTNSPERSTSLVETLAIAVVGAIDSTRDLDAYEALPDHLKSPRIQQAARERARDAIVADLDHFLHDADIDVIRSAAVDLEQRARWYGFDLDVGPLLDRADELAQPDQSDADWPEVVDEPENLQPGDFRADIRRLFSRLDD
jgi:hypothetical protein